MERTGNFGPHPKVTICRSLCRSGRFEVGEGACTFLCMDQLGDARVNCHHVEEIFGRLAQKIIDDLTTDGGFAK